MDDFLLREAEHKEAMAAELEKASEPAVRREAALQRAAAADLRREWQARQPAAKPARPAAAVPEPAASPAAAADEDESFEAASLRETIVDAIRSCYDPEIPVNIYDLGLVYAIRIRSQGQVEIDMTLTAPGCPAAGVLPGEVEAKVRSVPGVSDVHLELVWQPPWDQSRMSPAARLQLGIDW